MTEKLVGRDSAGLPVQIAEGPANHTVLSLGTFTLKAQAAPGLPCTGNEVASGVRGLARGDSWL